MNGIEEHDSIEEITKNPLHSFDYKRRETNEVLNIGGGNVPIVMADFCLKEKISPASFFALGSNYSVPLDKWHITDMAADYVFAGNHDIDFEVPGTLGIIYNYNKWKEHKKGYPFLTVLEYLEGS